MEKENLLNQLSNEIDYYLILIPNSVRYTEYHEKEAIGILNYVIEVFQKNKITDTPILHEIKEDLKYLDHCKGLTNHAKDAHFAWVINKIEKDLKKAKNIQSQSG